LCEIIVAVLFLGYMLMLTLLWVILYCQFSKFCALMLFSDDWATGRASLYKVHLNFYFKTPGEANNVSGWGIVQVPCGQSSLPTSKSFVMSCEDAKDKDIWRLRIKREAEQL